ncbi:MAG: redoxin domain-containing protein [Firmicutes bacterium]|jgi:hypothetical protein|nr:redoxin domain-containing protein [Bacillota bacterium]
MPQEFKPGCKRPEIKKKQDTGGAPAEVQRATEEVAQKMIRVGKPAPDFTAPAFYQGKFVMASLSEYLGKWVLLCFYPGDFTFV